MMVASLAFAAVFMAQGPEGGEPSAALLGSHLDLVEPEVAARRVAGCGFKHVQPKFARDLDEDVVEVTNVTSASRRQLRCAALASLDTNYYVSFPEPVNDLYQTLYWRMEHARAKADARAWLFKRGLLARLPVYDRKRSDEAVVARKLEALCGPKAARTLRPVGGMATFNEGALGTIDKEGSKSGNLDENTFLCVMNAATAAGYPVGFVGNEAKAEAR